MATKKSFRLKIFHKLLLAMLFIATIPLVGLLYNLLKAQQDWHTNVTVQLKQTAETVANKVDDWMDKNQRALGNAALLPSINSMEAEKQKPVLTAMLKSLEWTYLTFTTGMTGQNVARSDNKPPKYYGDREYFKQVKRRLPFGYQVLIGKTSGKPALVISKGVKAPTGELVGTIALAAHLSEVSKAVTDVKIGETGFAILLDSNGKVVAHGKSQELATKLQDFSDHPALLAGAIDERITFEEEGEQVVAYTKETSNGWTLIVQQSYDDAFATLIELKRYAMALLVGTLCLVLFSALLLGRRLVKPIVNLTSIAGDYSRGKLDAKIPGTDRGDELGELARAIERMGVSISMAFAKLTKQDLAA